MWRALVFLNLLFPVVFQHHRNNHPPPHNLCFSPISFFCDKVHCNKLKRIDHESVKLTSRAPPVTFLIPIMSRGMRSSRDITASTTILAKKSFCWWMSLLLREVPAHFSRMDRSSAGSCLLIWGTKYIVFVHWISSYNIG